MPITKDVSNVIQSTAAQRLLTTDGSPTGVVKAIDFAVCDNSDPTKQLAFVASGITSGSAVSVSAPTESGTMDKIVIQYATPATATTITVSSLTTHLVLEPAGTIATLDVIFAAAATNKKLNISSAKIITALNLAAAGSDTIVTSITTIAAVGGAASWVANTTKWYKI